MAKRTLNTGQRTLAPPPPLWTCPGTPRRNTNVPIASGKPALFTKELLVKVNPDVVSRPAPGPRPLVLPLELMRVLVGLQQTCGLQSVDTAAKVGYRFWHPVTPVAGLGPVGTPILAALTAPGLAFPGDLDGFLPGALPHAAAIDLATRLHLFFDTAANATKAARCLERTPNIVYAVKPVQGYFVAPGVPPAADPGLKIVELSDDWWCKATELMDSGQSRLKSAAGLKVALLDSGAEASHPALNGGVEGAASGYFPYSSGPDHLGHGTHLASIIAGRGDGSLNVPKGVLPDATVVSLRILGVTSGSTTVDMTRFRSALYALRHQYTEVKAVNLSIWMDVKPDQMILDDFDDLESAGVVLCACAGNNYDAAKDNTDFLDSSLRVLYPARLKNVLSVGSSGPDSQRSYFSRFSTKGDKGWNGNDYFALSQGRWPLVDIVAPGESILSATPKGKQFFAHVKDGAARARGTSMATPMVTAAVAYLRAQPNWTGATAEQIRRAIRLCVDPADIQWPNTAPDWVSQSDLYGAGLLNFPKLADWAGKVPGDLP